MAPQPASIISPSQAKAPFFLGVDVGGTSVKIGLVDDNGATLARSADPTLEEAGPEAAMQQAAAAMQSLLAGVGASLEQVAAVGLGAPGTMDIPSGMVLEPPNLPHWRYFPLRDCLADLCGKAVSFANDANAAAFGEYWVGSGRDYHSIVMLTLGTGVGGGIIIGGETVDGENSHGSECGHIVVDFHDDARLCPCGHPGHLEAYCSATSLIKRTIEAISAGRASSLAPLVEAGRPLSGLIIAEHADAGDTLAHDLIMETAHFLAAGTVTMMHAINPGAIILGGAMNFGGHDHPLGRAFLEKVRSDVHLWALDVPAERTRIDYATLGGHAGYIGAAGIARVAYHKK